MPIEYEIDHERHLIRTACTGNVGLESVLQHFRALAGEPELPDPLDVLLDLGPVTSVPDADQIQVVAAEVASLLDRIRWGVLAIVATRDLVFGVSRMFEARAEESFSAIRVVRERAAAEAWLAAERSLRPQPPKA